MKCSASYILKARITQLGRGKGAAGTRQAKNQLVVGVLSQGVPHLCQELCAVPADQSLYFCCPHHAASLFFLGVWERRGKELDSEHLPSKLPDFTLPESDFEPLTSKLPDFIYQNQKTMVSK